MIDTKVYFDNIDFVYENKSTDNDYIYNIINIIKKLEENEELKNTFIKELKEKYCIAKNTKDFFNIIKYSFIIFLLSTTLKDFKKKNPDYNLFNKVNNSEIINNIKTAFYEVIRHFLSLKEDETRFFHPCAEIEIFLNIAFYMGQMWEIEELYKLAKFLLENEQEKSMVFNYEIVSLFKKYKLINKKYDYHNLVELFINSIDDDFIKHYNDLKEIEDNIELKTDDYTKIYYKYKTFLEKNPEYFTLPLHMFVNHLIEKCSLSKDNKNKELMFLTYIYNERSKNYFKNLNIVETTSRFEKPITLQNQINNLKYVLNNRELEINNKILYLIETVHNVHKIINNIIEEDKKANPLTYVILKPQIISTNLNKIFKDLSYEENVKGHLFLQEISDIVYFYKKEFKNLLANDTIVNYFNVPTKKHKKLIKDLLLLYIEDNLTVFIPMMILFVEYLNTYFNEKEFQLSTTTIFFYEITIGKKSESLRNQMAHGELSNKIINGDYADVLLVLFLLYATN